MFFVDAAYGNKPTNRRSATGFDFKFYGGAFVYRSKTQSINAFISTEADLIYDVTYAKTARLLRYMLWYLGFPQEYPTPIYEDNDPTIDIVNSGIPTEITRHIDVRFFDIQGWKEAGDIIIHNTPGVISPAGDITKQLGGILHFGNSRCLMGHYNIIFERL